MYVINLDDKNSKGANLVSFLIDIKLAAYFVSFGIKYISLELLNKIREKSNQLLAICLESKIMNVKKDWCNKKWYFRWSKTQWFNV